jgi:enoyl-CoA hydratase/carnithine racemase
MSDSVLVDFDAAGRVAVVTLNRPDARNAMSTELAENLVSKLASLAATRTLRVVVLTGSGDRAFCAGADLKERSGMTDEQWLDQHVVFEEMFMALRRFPRPIFTAANGVAAGGGLEIALCTDFILAAENARFGAPEVRVGIIPGGGATQLLPQMVSLGLARRMLASGELIDAHQALAAGLVTSVHPQEELLDAAKGLAESIARNSPSAVKAVRAAVNDGLGVTLEDGVELYLEHYRGLVRLGDRHEGVAAFNEKREPEFADPES